MCSTNLGQCDSWSTWRPSLLKIVHTLKAKSCSLGMGDTRERASLSYSEGLYRSTDIPPLTLIDSVKDGEDEYKITAKLNTSIDFFTFVLC